MKNVREGILWIELYKTNYSIKYNIRYKQKKTVSWMRRKADFANKIEITERTNRNEKIIFPIPYVSTPLNSNAQVELS